MGVKMSKQIKTRLSKVKKQINTNKIHSNHNQATSNHITSFSNDMLAVRTGMFYFCAEGSYKEENEKCEEYNGSNGNKSGDELTENR